MTPFARALRERIALEGPITVERYMGLCLSHYYGTRDPLGARGDFTTAPEISQMFGELIGLWAAAIWTAMGAPAPVRLVELGPGRGTLMADLLRAARALPAFRRALEVHLVETSPALRARQQERLAGSDAAIVWHRTFEEVPPGPVIAVANEFFDALPVRQFVATARGWCERLVGLGEDGGLGFGLRAEPEPGPAPPSEPNRFRLGEVREVSPAGLALAGALAARIAAEGGAALVVDYGHAGGTGDTLQALSRHAFADPLAEPGEADLTAHVDFAALARAGRAAGAAVHGPVAQGAFLEALGIGARSETLARAAPGRRAGIEADRRRLTGPGPGGMGELFKALAFTHPGLAPPPGF